MRFKTLIAILIFTCLGLLIYFNFIPATKPKKTEIPAVEQRRKINIQIENKAYLTADVARTREEQTKGLSGRTSLGDNEGMLFAFTESAKYTFWMKEMLFSIDIIWIREGKIIEITENLPFPSLAIYSPQGPVDLVLEVNAGWVKKNGIKTGDKITFANY